MKKYFEFFVLGILIFYLAVFWFLPSSSNYSVYFGEGESMTPTFNTGDLLIFKSPEGKVKPGMIVVYEHKEKTRSHRVISVDGQNLTTKGDGKEEPDPWSVSTSDVKGVYLFKIRFLGYLLTFVVETPFGEILLSTFLIVILAGLFIVYEIINKNSALRRTFRNLAKGKP